MPDPSGYTEWPAAGTVSIPAAADTLLLTGPEFIHQSAFRPVYSVMAYGAVGDGTEDDSAAIQAALDAMPATGGVLFFPVGTYKIVTCIDVEKSVSFECEPGTVLSKTTAAPAYFFRVKASNLAWRGFTFQGGEAGQVGGVLARDVAVANKLDNRNIVFEDCELDDCWLYFERLGSTINDGETLATGSDVYGDIVVHRCHFHDVDGAAFACYCAGGINVTVDTCRFTDILNETADYGNGVKLCNGARNWRVTDNYFYNTQRTFMSFFDSRRGIASGNHCDTSIAGQGIAVKVGVGHLGDPVEVISIIGNYVRGTAEASGISAECDNVVILGNMVEDCSTGIRAWVKTGEPYTRTVNNMIAHNWIRTCAYGVRVWANRAIIQGNQVHDSTAEGIYVDAGDYLILSDNIVWNSTRDDIVFAGSLATCIVRDNMTEDGTPLHSESVIQSASAAIADGNTAITAANLQAQVLTMAATEARAPTVPTGTAMNGIVDVGRSIDWSFINTAAGAYAITVTAATDHTLVGYMVIGQNETGRFRTRVSAANTSVTYRLA